MNGKLLAAVVGLWYFTRDSSRQTQSRGSTQPGGRGAEGRGTVKGGSGFSLVLLDDPDPTPLEAGDRARLIFQDPNTGKTERLFVKVSSFALPDPGRGRVYSGEVDSSPTSGIVSKGARVKFLQANVLETSPK